MHILLIPSWYSTPKNPIRGSFFFDQALALTDAGHQVGMLVPPSRLRTLNGLSELHANWRKSPDAVTITNDAGVTIYRIPWWGWIASCLPWRRGNLVLKVFNEYCQHNGIPDVLHGHSILYGGYLAAFIGKKRSIVSLLTEHSSLYITDEHQIGHDYFIRFALREIDKVLAVGPALRDALQKYDKGLNISILGNVVNTDEFTLAEKVLPPSPFVISIFGMIDANKAQDILLKAFALAFKDKVARLNIVGDGNKRRVYQQLAEELGIAAQVHFYGQVPRPDVIQLMHTSHIVVSSSYTETFGVSLVEAMACGKPVVATHSGGPESFVDDKSGILVPPGNIQALADALVCIRENYSTYNPQAIRQIVVNRFSEYAIAQQLTTHYESLRS